jgi:hypothetical protein
MYFLSYQHFDFPCWVKSVEIENEMKLQLIFSFFFIHLFIINFFGGLGFEIRALGLLGR